jgi:serine phosphatase RsbU (regulator of sigma subunit)
VLLAVADVSGKGLQGALVASSLHSLVHAYVAEERSLGRLVKRLNAHLCRYLPDESFVTMACVAIDPSTGDTEAVNAGHLPPIVVGRNGVERRLKAAGIVPLGLQTQEVEGLTDQIGRGELLALFTDGLTEMPSPTGELLTLSGLIDCLTSVCRSANGATIEELVANVTASLDQRRGAGEMCDDCTLVLTRWR